MLGIIRYTWKNIDIKDCIRDTYNLTYWSVAVILIITPLPDFFNGSSEAFAMLKLPNKSISITVLNPLIDVSSIEDEKFPYIINKLWKLFN